MRTPRVPKVLEPTLNQQETPRRSSRAKAQVKEKEKEKSESENSSESAEETEETEKNALTSSLFCGYCKVEYNSDPTIKRHFRTKHPECDYNQILTSLHCETCERDFDDQRQFAVHMVRNHMELWVFDDFGNRKKSQDENKGVLDTIKNEDRFSCELCAKTFTTKSRLSTHKETVHGAYDR